MDALTTVRFFSDVFLAGSVVFCAVKMFKSGVSFSHLRKVQDLENTIRELIKEADTAGHNLQDALERRQKNLDRSITELEAIESRATKSVEGAQSFVSHIDGTVVQKVHNEVQKKSIELSMMIPSSTHELSEEFIEEEVKPKRASAPIQQQRPLRTHIERESIHSTQDDLQQVVQFAGQLIESGRDIEFVSARTKLSVSQLQKLFPQSAMPVMQQITPSHIPEDQRIEVRSDIRTDPRLGALGGMKRVTQTL